MGSIALDATMQTRELAAASAALRKESRVRDSLMDEVRNDTYRSTTLVRDYLREPDEPRADAQRQELQRLRLHVEASLRQYASITPAAEKTEVQNLQREAAANWNWFDAALAWDHATRLKQGDAFLRNSLVDGRDRVVEFVGHVGQLNEKMLAAGEEQIQNVQARFQSRVKAYSSLALLLGGILAIAVFRRSQRLAAEAGIRFAEVLAAREDLRRLSDRLVKVQEEERRILSRELHDELGQSMSAILLEVRKLEGGAGATALQMQGLASVRRIAEENVAKVRDMALLLRPAMLDELGLVPALRWHAREVTRRTGLKVKMIADELSDDLSESTRTCIYRMVQEALNNCVKHAQAREVRVVIHRDTGGLSVFVQDDGVGFDPARNKGLGLIGMTERVTGLGGKIHIESRPRGGTVLSSHFPLELDKCRPERESVA